MRVSYPLKDISTDAEAKNYLGNRNLFGKYPIGAHNAWHGGIHLEGASREIQCIAQGRIIAYRFAKEYKKTIINNTDHLYSNGFILIQHDYKSKEKQKMTFYSLYHQLMPESDIISDENSAKIPKFLSKSSYIIISKEGIPIEGLNARVLKNNKIDISEKGVSVVIPKGSTVNLAPLEDNKINTGSYKRINYTDKDGKTYTDIYIYVKIGKQVKKITENTLEIITTEDETENKSVLGARVRESGKSSSKIIKIVPYDEVLEIDETVKGNWKKLKDGSGFIHNSGFTTKITFDNSKGKLDEITACDIPIKAGVTIGYTGNLGFKGYKGYKATHLEVFTTDDVFEFLSNEKKDGKEEQYFTNIIAGTKLKTSLSYKVDIKANTPIKVLKIKGDYAQIKVTSITATLVRDTDINDNVKPFNSNKLYTIKNLTTVNKAFNGLATKDATFNTKQVKAPRNWRTNLNRTVTFYPNGYGKVFWVEKTFISKITEKTKKKAGIFVSITPDYFLTEEQKYDTVEREAKTGEKTTLYVDVCKAYIEVPFRTDVEEVTVEKEKVVDLRKFKKAKDDKKDLWYKVVLDDTTSGQCVAVKGWVKEKDLDKFSAYDWQKFGFKDLDAGNEYIYSVKDLCKATDSAAFVTEIWDKTIDTDGNKVLDILELIRAFSKPEIAQKLSRLVCKHKNEWSYTMDEIKPEVKELYDFGIQLEEVTAEKQKLETERDDSLAKMETKIENLMWWDEASKKTYTAPIKEEDKTKTSSTKRPSMLPEGTVVEEIPQKDVVPLDNKTTAAKPDAKPTEDSIPTTSTTAAPAPETKVEEKEVPPKRMFPKSNIVHHFHPIAWVEQMRRVFGDEKCPRCQEEITVENLNETVGNKNDQDYRKQIVTLINEYINKRKGTANELHINTCLLKAHFISQITTETGLLKIKLTEGNSSPYYSKNNIKALWGAEYKKMVNNGTIVSIASERPQKQLLNTVYGSKNGNKGGDDGWNYRGRGLIQLTGKSNYKNASTYLKKVFSDEYLDLELNYQKVSDIKYAVLSAIAFWEGKEVYVKAKKV